MFFLAIGDLPGSWYTIIGLPVLLAMIGGGIWILGRMAELKQGAPPWKWLGIVPMFFALWVGFGTSSKMGDFLYRDLIEPLGKKAEIAHYCAFFLPLVILLGVAGWEFYDRSRARTD